MSIDYNINLTDNALTKIHLLAAQENDENSVLRITVSGGGCSGFKYNFLMDKVRSSTYDDEEYDDEIENDDGNGYEDYEDFENEDDNDEDDYSNKKTKDIIINDRDGKPVLMIDDCSAKFLKDSIIDYTESLGGSSFQIKNKLAKSQCGCGSSFSV